MLDIHPWVFSYFIHAIRVIIPCDQLTSKHLLVYSRLKKLRTTTQCMHGIQYPGWYTRAIYFYYRLLFYTVIPKIDGNGFSMVFPLITVLLNGTVRSISIWGTPFGVSIVSSFSTWQTLSDQTIAAEYVIILYHIIPVWPGNGRDDQGFWRTVLEELGVRALAQLWQERHQVKNGPCQATKDNALTFATWIRIWKNNEKKNSMKNLRWVFPHMFKTKKSKWKQNEIDDRLSCFGCVRTLVPLDLFGMT